MTLKKTTVYIEYRNVPWNISFLFLVKKKSFPFFLSSNSNIMNFTQQIKSFHLQNCFSWSMIWELKQLAPGHPLTRKESWQLELLHRQLIFQVSLNKMAGCFQLSFHIIALPDCKEGHNVFMCFCLIVTSPFLKWPSAWWSVPAFLFSKCFKSLIP